jgi:hypothetical protein
MQAVSILHDGIANMTWMFFLVLGVWGLYRAIRGDGIDGNYYGAAVIGQLLFVVQAILGGFLWLNGLDITLARAGVHLLYGVFVLIFLPFIYFTVLQGDDSNRGQWVIAFTTLFLFGVSLRLIGLGHEAIIP